MNERDYLKACRELETQYQRGLESLALAGRLIHKTEPPSTASARHPARKTATASPPVVSGGLVAAVEEVLADVSERFTTLELDNAFRKRFPDLASTKKSSISHALKRLASMGGKIELVEAGEGRRPSSFRKLVVKPEHEANGQGHSTEARTATDVQQSRIRQLVNELHYSPSAFLEKVLVGEYAVKRLAHLDVDDAADLISRLSRGEFESLAESGP